LFSSIQFDIQFSTYVTYSMACYITLVQSVNSQAAHKHGTVRVNKVLVASIQ